MVEDLNVPNARDNVKSRRRRVGIGLAIAVFVAVLLIAAAIYYQKATSLGDPLFSNIDESDIVAAKIYSGEHAHRYTDQSMVDVPPSLAFEILSALMPNRPDPRPAAWVIWGALEFKLKSGKEYGVLLFHTNDEEAAFRMDRYYRGGSDAKLSELLREAERLIEEEHEPRPMADKSG